MKFVQEISIKLWALDSMNAIRTIGMSVSDVRTCSHDVKLFELTPLGTENVPDFEPGSHVDIALPTGIVRSYSLVNGPDVRDRYRIAVKREPLGRGGSTWLHDHVALGTVLQVSQPRNAFPLDVSATHSVLIAGGIGITPILSMIQMLEALGRPWTLHFAAASSSSAPMLDEVLALGCASHVGTVRASIKDFPNAVKLDLDTIVREAPAQSHFYCCGPARMLEAFDAATVSTPTHRVHSERFLSDKTAASDHAFKVKLAISDREVLVSAGQTIVEALRTAGISVPTSCEQGVCGACETRVISGIPDHRDLVLTSDEQARNDIMMLCCSGSKSDLLVLDL
ncbi:PDR/VanB family oxidoreductase [Burkholderia sp. PU8-34]